MPRPELGELKPGQPVMVRRSANEMRRRPPEERYIPAQVVKASRVWIELKAAETAPDAQRWMTWRMRRDTQNEGTQYSGSDASFATTEQHEWDQTQAWAWGVIKDNGLTVEPRSPWRGREQELADLLTKTLDT